MQDTAYEVWGRQAALMTNTIFSHASYWTCLGILSCEIRTLVNLLRKDLLYKKAMAWLDTSHKKKIQAIKITLTYIYIYAKFSIVSPELYQRLIYCWNYCLALSVLLFLFRLMQLHCLYFSPWFAAGKILYRLLLFKQNIEYYKANWNSDKQIYLIAMCTWYFPGHLSNNWVELIICTDISNSLWCYCVFTNIIIIVFRQ